MYVSQVTCIPRMKIYYLLKTSEVMMIIHVSAVVGWINYRNLPDPL